MWTVLGAAGSLIWPLFKWVAPWAGPRFSLIAIGGLLVLVIAGAPAFGMWIHMRGELKQAVAEEGARWHQAIQKANADHEARLTAALDAADHEERNDPTPAVAGRQLVSLCDRSRACRDRKK
jgi:hypothetical protein